MAKSRDYEAALRELEQLHTAGKIDKAKYDVHRTKLLAEASGPQLRWWHVARNLVTSALIVVVVALVLMALVNN